MADKKSVKENRGAKKARSIQAQPKKAAEHRIAAEPKLLSLKRAAHPLLETTTGVRHVSARRGVAQQWVVESAYGTRYAAPIRFRLMLGEVSVVFSDC